MLNNNWTSILRSVFIQQVLSDNLKNVLGTNVSPYPVGIKNIFGSSVGKPSTSWVEITEKTENEVTFSSNDQGGIYLLLGSSEVEPTLEDYKLGNIITDYTTISQSHYFNNSQYFRNPSFLTLTRVIQNTTEVPIIIKEIGAYLQLQSISKVPVMIAREVIEPVTLQPGEKHSFTMDISVV